MGPYVRKLYLNDWILPMTLSIASPYKACVSIEDVTEGQKGCLMAEW